MLYIFITAVAIIAAPFVFIRLERWWIRRTKMMIRNDYLSLLTHTLAGKEVDIEAFTRQWKGHPSCETYTNLLTLAAGKAQEQHLGV